MGEFVQWDVSSNFTFTSYALLFLILRILSAAEKGSSHQKSPKGTSFNTSFDGILNLRLEQDNAEK